VANDLDDFIVLYIYTIIRMKLEQKNREKYVCESCNYITSNKYDYSKHILTAKHKKRDKSNDLDEKIARNIYTCNVCSKSYSARNSLWYHNKTCRINPILAVIPVETNVITDLLTELKLEREENKELLRRNEEQQKQMMDLQHQFLEAIKNGSLGNTTNSNNTQNNQFNLQFYLNETCKDAINLDEFLQSIQLTSQDYVNTGEVGFITGLTDIFRKELHKLEPHNRPLQCTDVKREVIYVKENDKWAKDIENKKTKNIVRRIDISYQRMMYQWMKENPEHVEEEGPLVEEGIKYSTVCLGNNRLNGNEPIFRNKIFTNILDDIAIKKGNKIITVE